MLRLKSHQIYTDDQQRSTCHCGTVDMGKSKRILIIVNKTNIGFSGNSLEKGSKVNHNFSESQSKLKYPCRLFRLLLAVYMFSECSYLDF